LPGVGAFAPTLGFVGKPRWGLDAATRHHPKYSRRYGTTVIGIGLALSLWAVSPPCKEQTVNVLFFNELQSGDFGHF
ncbi:MAG: hypothetical protein LBT53_07285, partial [Puniceicoccales bacterium]|nr:hypothetical protein [Puniceicoccales bacterium]